MIAKEEQKNLIDSIVNASLFDKITTFIINGRIIIG